MNIKIGNINFLDIPIFWLPVMMESKFRVDNDKPGAGAHFLALYMDCPYVNIIFTFISITLFILNNILALLSFYIMLILAALYY